VVTQRVQREREQKFDAPAADISLTYRGRR
jgi:hypothetical protein